MTLSPVAELWFQRNINLDIDFVRQRIAAFLAEDMPIDDAHNPGDGSQPRSESS